MNSSTPVHNPHAADPGTPSAAKFGSTETARKASQAAEHSSQLWETYLRKRDVEARNALIEAYIPMVKREAIKLAATLSNTISPQELESAGTLGLIDSIDSFAPHQGSKFTTFCTPRLRGAMFDELRSRDWVPRTTRAKLNRLERAINHLEHRLGRDPEGEEIAREMGLSESEVQKLFSDKNRALLSLDAPVAALHMNGMDKDVSPGAILEEQFPGADPMHNLQKKEVVEAVRKILGRTERLVVTLYYYEELNLREIGQVLGLTESRICQIHSKVVETLKKQLA